MIELRRHPFFIVMVPVILLVAGAKVIWDLIKLAALAVAFIAATIRLGVVATRNVWLSRRTR